MKGAMQKNKQGEGIKSKSFFSYTLISKVPSEDVMFDQRPW